jgi:hypothetical protein
MNMPNWPALLVAPLIAFTNGAIAYALVSPSCSHQEVVNLHLLSIASLLACFVVTVPAALNWQRARALAGRAESPAQARHRFLSQVGTLTALLSTLVVLAEWLPVWIVSPCSA